MKGPIWCGQDGSRRGGGWATAVRLILLAALLTCLALLLWPVRFPPVSWSSDDLAVCRVKVSAMEAAILAGVGSTQRFTQAEVNAYLGARMEGNGKDFGVAFHPGYVEIRGISARGPVSVRWRVAWRPDLKRGVDRMSIGAFPVPRLLAGWCGRPLLDKIAEAFGRERLLLLCASDIRVGEDGFQVVLEGTETTAAGKEQTP